MMAMTLGGVFTRQDLALLRGKWGILLAFGFSIVALGLLAFFNVVIATVASIYYVGASMLVAGILQIAHAFQLRGWRSFLSWLMIGLVYALAGVLAFVNPLLASSFLTLLLAISLLVVGLLRILAGLSLRPTKFASWLLVAGAITLFVGVFVLAGWPLNSRWFIGLLLAMDLTFHDIAMVIFAIALRNTPMPE